MNQTGAFKFLKIISKKKKNILFLTLSKMFLNTNVLKNIMILYVTS